MVNGNLERTDSKGGLLGWRIDSRSKSNVQMLDENGNHFVRISNDNAGNTLYLEQKVPVDPSWKQVTVTCRMRSKDYKPGTGSAQDARVLLSFRDSQGEHLNSTPAEPKLPGDSPAWIERNVTLDVPVKSTVLHVQLYMKNTTGVVDFDDIRVAPVK